ncbi:MAG: V/A-type H+/Na+-transporting ATPase subunit [Synergistales bacterium]|nr:V/A-type H+/Na+-transporting ATPase subunit [Synergistales bacterium]
MEKPGIITGITGPVVKARTDASVSLYEVVHVGEKRLLGEVVRIDGPRVDLQVYEDTSGMRIGEPVAFTGDLLSVELGPGLLGGVLDGIGRPLHALAESGIFIGTGIEAPAVPQDLLWEFEPLVKEGDEIGPGDAFGFVTERTVFRHMIMVHPEARPGRVLNIKSKGKYTPRDMLVETDSGYSGGLTQKWHVRKGRPYKRRLGFSEPLVTGQRVIDTLFPLALGGAAVVPGGFGTGKTVTQQSLAKWCSADIIVYIGCGERGNEMTEVLEEFPELQDPHSGRPLLDRMVLIANTSNMPVAARESSIYLGMTIAEYFRDQGRNVAIMSDSTSRWAEALREIAGRLEEMPGEEGYPAYLSSRLSQYYERAGRVEPIGKEAGAGSVTVINAVSPAGGDFSEPVTQASLRLSGTFWALDKSLAQQRHFPSINWKQSFSLYEKSLGSWFAERLGEKWHDDVAYLRDLLDMEKNLQELVQIVGRDALTEEDKWKLHLGGLVRVAYLQQNAFDPNDAYCSLEKQHLLLDCLRRLDQIVHSRIEDGLLFHQVQERPLAADLLALLREEETTMKERIDVFLEGLREALSKMEVAFE